MIWNACSVFIESISARSGRTRVTEENQLSHGNIRPIVAETRKRSTRTETVVRTTDISRYSDKWKFLVGDIS